MSRNRAMTTRTGAVIQSGLDARPKGTVPLMRMPTMVPYRAIVLNTYTTDDDENRGGVAVECDVFLVRACFRLARVPVKQINHGRNNSWLPWVPRPSTRVISTGDGVNFTTRSARGTPQGDASVPSDLDGDLVIVEFMEADPDRPLITGALSHDQNLRRVIGSASDADASLGWKDGDYRAGSPRRNELYIGHYGSELRINGRGDVLLSTVDAFEDPIEEDPSPAVGEIRVRVKDSRRCTIEMDGTDVFEIFKDGAQVRVDLGEGAAQRLVLGDDFRTFLNAELVAKLNNLITLFNAHLHSGGTISGNTGVPSATDPDSVSQMSTDLLSDLAKTKKS